MAYNKMFECGRIKELAELYPDLTVHLLNMRDHIVDLIDPMTIFPKIQHMEKAEADAAPYISDSIAVE